MAGNPWDYDPIVVDYGSVHPDSNNWNYSSGSSFGDTGAVSQVDTPWMSDPIYTPPAIPDYTSHSPFNFLDDHGDSLSPWLNDPVVQPESKVKVEDPFNWQGKLPDMPYQPSAQETVNNMSRSEWEQAMSRGGGLFGEVPSGKAPAQFIMGALTAPTFGEAGTYGLAGIANDMTPAQFAEKSSPQYTDTLVDKFGKWPTQKAIEFGANLLDPVQAIEAEGLGDVVGTVAKPVMRGMYAGLETVAKAEIPYLSSSVKGVGQFVSRTFAKTEGQKTLINILDQAAQKRGSNVVELANEASLQNVVVDDIAKKYGMNAEGVKRMLGQAIETKTPTVPVMGMVDRPTMPMVKPPTDETLNMFIEDPISDIPKIDMKQVPLVRGQSTADVFEYNPLTKTSFSNIVAPTFGEETPAATLGLGGRNQRNKVVGFFTPDKPLYVESAGGSLERTGLAEFALPKLYEEDVAASIWRNDNYAKAVAKNLGVPDNEIEQLMKRPIDLRDRIVSEKARQMGYDSVFAVNPNGTHGEVAILEPYKLPKAVPNQLETVVSEDVKPTVQKIQQQMQYLTGNQIPDEVAQMALDAKLTRNQKWLEGNKAGLITPELQDAHVDYILHNKTRDSVKILKKYKPDWFEGRGGRVINPTHNSQLARSLTEMPIDEINALGVKGKIPGLDGIKFPKFLEDDPIKLEAFRQVRDETALMDLKVLDDAAQRLAWDTTKSGPAPEGWVKAAIADSSDPRLANVADRYKNLYFEPTTAVDLNKAVTINRLPEFEQAFTKYFTDVTNVWRGLTLNLSPSAISRNVVGNLYNNALAGVKPQFYTTAMDLQGGGIRQVIERVNGEDVAKWVHNEPLMREGLTLGGKHYSADALQSMFKDYGIQSSGFATVETHNIMEEMAGAGVKATDIPYLGRVARQGQIANKFMEDNARMAHFLSKLDEGKTPMEAAASVEKYLFDYMNGLTPGLKFTRKYATPFIAWQRFNVPLQIESLLGMTASSKAPIRLAQVINTLRDDNAQSKLNNEFKQKGLTPDYINQLTGVPVKYDENGVMTFQMFGSMIPIGDLDFLLGHGQLFDKLISMMNPVWKEGIAQVSGYDPQTGQKLSGQYNYMFGQNMPARVTHLLKNVRVLADIDRLFQGDMYTNPQLLTSTQRTTTQKAMQYLFGLTQTKVDYNSRIQLKRAEYDTLKNQYRSAARKGDKKNADRLLNDLEHFWE